METKKNTDYSASAVNLQPENEKLKFLLDTLRVNQLAAETIQKNIEELIPLSMKEELTLIQTRMGETENKIKEVVNESGSYQDLITGQYAVKQRRVSKSYDAEKFAMCYGEYTPEVLTTAVKVTALEKLIKEGKVREDILKEKGALTEKLSYVWIIQ
jgi:hypothetical protein